MGRSESLYHLQQLDTAIDSARKRVSEIDRILGDDKSLKKAQGIFSKAQTESVDKTSLLKIAEKQVADQNTKIEQNQKKLYSGAITNPKELEDLQLEATSLTKYLHVLEDKQLEAMLAAEEGQAVLDQASAALESVMLQRESEHKDLLQEKAELLASISNTEREKDLYLSSESLPDLDEYRSLRESTGGIAVTLMVSSSCMSCGANIPSAIEQQARSPSNLAFCPTCKRILYSE
jgi:predicted  nucleic acid-binding Zn-ribbon protein